METMEINKEIKKMLNARSVAVVGASSNQEKWGYRILKNIIDGGYTGKIYPVNPKSSEILGCKVYPSVKAIPGGVELLIIVVPAGYVPEVIEEGIEQNACGAVIITGGFRETGREDLEKKLTDIIQDNNFRIIGPNVQGINYIPNKLCAVVLPLITRKGRVSIISQSGSVSATLSQWFENDGVGITAMVNLGNQIDLCETDFLRYFKDDLESKVIALYLEGPRKKGEFKEILNQVTNKKPVVVFKPGRTNEGKKVALSHTASIAGNDKIFSAACKQFGAIRTYDMEAFFDTVKIFGLLEKMPEGKRIMVFTTSGGVGSITVDKLSEKNLSISPTPEEAIKHFKDNNDLPHSSFNNPADFPLLVGEDWRKPLKTLKKYENMADLVLFSIADAVDSLENVIVDLDKEISLPIVVAYMGGGKAGLKAKKVLQDANIPVFPTPGRAVNSIANLVKYAEIRRGRSER